MSFCGHAHSNDSGVSEDPRAMQLSLSCSARSLPHLSEPQNNMQRVFEELHLMARWSLDTQLGIEVQEKDILVLKKYILRELL